MFILLFVLPPLGSGDDEDSDAEPESSLAMVGGTSISGDVGDGGARGGPSSFGFLETEFVRPAAEEALFFSSVMHSSR